MTTVPPRPDRFSALVSSPNWGGRTTRAEIDLSAIKHNVSLLRDLISPAQLVVVVKADAYGHGSRMVAHAALSAGAGSLAVYTVDEARALRDGGIDAPILVLGPFSSTETSALWAYHITPTIHSMQAAEWLHRSDSDRRISVHVKLDTGLARAGIAADQASAFFTILRQRFPSLSPVGLYTHFAAADDTSSTVTSRQVDEFRRALTTLHQEGFDFDMVHTSNSAGLLRHPEARFDAVRAGIAVYGYYPSDLWEPEIGLRPAMQLVSSVSRVHTVPVGGGVGYGHEFVASRSTVVALVPIGYGDGLPRALGGGQGRVLIRGRSVPIIGRVSMDQITVDASDVPGVSVGDLATLIGINAACRQNADDLGAQAGTISYDILTGLMPRVPRIYVEDGAMVAVQRASPSVDMLNVKVASVPANR